MFSELGDLPTKLANKMRRRFEYAIDPESTKFSSLLSAATILHPGFYTFLSQDLFEKGKQEIEQWFSNVSTQVILNQATVPETTFLNRLLAKQRQENAHFGITKER